MSFAYPFLFLFDVDGTLIHSDGAGSGAVRRAFAEYFGKEPDMTGYRFDGKTDPIIFTEMAAIAGIDPEVFAANRIVFEDLVYDLMSHLVREKDIRTIPGIIPVLDHLARQENVFLGLVTGNDYRGACHKLDAVDLRLRFPVGAYGNDGPEREKLPPVAVSRARRLFGVDFQPQHVWVIGDTPADVRCGKAGGYRTIAVSTGNYPAALLEEAQPDVYTDSLTTTLFDRILDEIAREGL